MILDIRRIALIIGFSWLIINALTSCEDHEEDFSNRDAFIASWNVVEQESPLASTGITSRSINDAYIARISRDFKLADQVSIHNFFDMGDTFFIPAYIDGQKIIIPEIELKDYVFKGSGVLSDDKKTIEWVYSVDMGYGDIQYTATYTRR